MIGLRGAAAVAAALAATGCAPRPAAGGGQDVATVAAASSDSVHGKVARTGAEPRPELVLIQPGGQLLLGGPLADELGHLSGMEVTLWGHREPPAERFMATGYRIDSVDGAPARVGIVVIGSDGGAQLAGADTVRLTGAPAEMAKLAGAKVWVTGQDGPGGLAVGSYGVIREAPGQP